MRGLRCSSVAVLVGLILAAPTVARAEPDVKPAAPPVAISEEAKQAFNAGVALLQDPEGEKVEDAYREFKTAYELSSSPKILGNMGFCAMRLERDGEAIEAYSRYLREVAEIDPDERAQIVRDLQTLSVGVTRVVVTTNVPGAAVTILDERVPVRGPHVTNAYGPVSDKLAIGIRPGHHVLTAKLAGRVDAVWEMEAYAGAKDAHTFTLGEQDPGGAGRESARGQGHEGRSSVGPILVLSAGAAMLVAGGITGIVALSKTSDIDDHCPGNVCPRSFDLDGARSSARTIVGVTDLLLLVGAVTTLGGLYWGYRVWRDHAPEGPSVKAAGVLTDWRLTL